MVIANPPLAEPVIDPGGVTIKPPFEMGVANLELSADINKKSWCKASGRTGTCRKEHGRLRMTEES